MLLAFVMLPLWLISILHSLPMAQVTRGSHDRRPHQHTCRDLFGVKGMLSRLAPIKHGMYRREVRPAEGQAGTHCMRVAKGL